MADELKPCPWCGCFSSIDNDFGRDFWVQCGSPACGRTDGVIYRTPREAIAAWNTRHQPNGGSGAEDARDAARYRWLRDEAIRFPYDVEIASAWCVYVLNCSGADIRPIDGQELDQAIDAAQRFAEQDAAMSDQNKGKV